MKLQFKNLLLLLLILAGIAATSSCSREVRAQRHLKRAVELDPKILDVDTVWQEKKVLVHDTTELEKVVTIFQFGKKDSTAKLPPQVPGGKSGTVSIKHKPNGGIDVTVDRPADTIYKDKFINVEIPVIKYKYIQVVKVKRDFAVPIITAIFGLLTGAFLTYKFYKR